MSEAIAKPSVNPLTLTYTVGSNESPVFTMSITGLQLQIQAEIEDVTGGSDSSRRLAKTGLVQGRILASGYMAVGSTFAVLQVIDEESGQGNSITIGYGDGASTKTFTGYVESIEMNSNKTKAFVGVAVAFRLAGPQTDEVDAT